MSFSSEVKREILDVDYLDHCERAFLSAFLQINSSLQIINQTMGLVVRIENAMIAKSIFSMLKNRYQVNVELTVTKKETLRKNNIYTLEVSERSMEILTDLGIVSEAGFLEVPDSKICEKACCKRSYLAGAFVASGSINAPQSTNYHMELVVETDKLSKFLQKLLLQVDLQAKITMRRGRYVVYIKQADQIADFLKTCRAMEKTFDFEDVRIQRDFTNSLTRINNTQLANDYKSVKAATKHLDAIYVLIEHNVYNQMDKKLIEVAELRMNHPDASLNELIDYFEEVYQESISKSGLQHRFNKILDLAEKVL